jgi:hypothetical protein
VSEYDLPVKAQVAGDLGRRMSAAVAEVTSTGRIAVVVGADCPLLAAGHVEAAAGAVRNGADVALVPAEDGGYVLIAMARAHTSLFASVEWGSPDVVATTRARARREGLVLAELDALWDVDDAADLARYRAL